MHKIGFSLTVYLSIVLFGASAFIFAGTVEHAKFQNFTESNGLPSNLIVFTIKDSRGFIWVGTSRGITRFDGNIFRKFTDEDFAPPAEKITYSSMAMEVNDTCLLFISQREKLIYYNYKTGKFHELPVAANRIRYILNRKTDDGFIALSEKQLLVFNRSAVLIETLALDKDVSGAPFMERPVLAEEDILGNIWLPTAEDNLFIYRKKEKRLKKFSEYKNSRINNIAVSPDGKSVFITSLGSGVIVIDALTNRVTETYKPESNIRKGFSPIPTAIYPERDSLFWLGTYAGLFYINRYTKQVQEYTNYPGNSSSLKENYITHIYSSEANLWIGTVGGLSRYTLRSESPALIKHDPEDIFSLANNTVNVIHRISVRHIIFGTEKGLSVRDDHSGKFYHFNIPKAPGSISEPTAITLYKDSFGAYWLGTWGYKIFHLTFTDLQKEKPGIIFTALTSLNAHFNNVIYTKLFKEDIHGNLYISTWGNGLIKIDAGSKNSPNPAFQVYNKQNSGLPTNHFADIILNGDTIYLAGSSGLCIFNPVRRQHTIFNYEPGKTNSQYNRITYLLPYKNGRILVGTYGGPYIYSPTSGIAQKFPSNYSFDDNSSLQAVVDKKGRLWYNKSNSKILIYDTNDNSEQIVDLLQEYEGFYFSFGTAYADFNGDIYFSGYTGALKIPSEIKKFNPNPPPIRLTGISIINRKYYASSDYSEVSSITLHYPEQDFSINYAALSFVNSSYNQYKYQLTGYDRNWIDAGKRTEAIYTNIPYGSYTFTVIGCNNEGVWNYRGATLQIIIVPPFWSTHWFRILSATLFISLVTYIVRRRFTKLEEQKTQQESFTRKLIETQERERKRIASELHDGLGQNLLVIKNMVQLLPDNSEDITDIQQLVAETIDDTRNLSGRLHPHQLDSLGLHKTLIPLFKKLSKIHKITIQDKIRDLPKNLSKEHEITLYRVIQEALNNIIKHSKATQVDITLETHPSFLFLQIEDNGTGFDAASSSLSENFALGFGIKSMQERIKLLNGEFSLSSILNKGTTIVIKLPL